MSEPVLTLQLTNRYFRLHLLPKATEALIDKSRIRAIFRHKNEGATQRLDTDRPTGVIKIMIPHFEVQIFNKNFYRHLLNVHVIFLCFEICSADDTISRRDKKIDRFMISIALLYRVKADLYWKLLVWDFPSLATLRKDAP